MVHELNHMKIPKFIRFASQSSQSIRNLVVYKVHFSAINSHLEREVAGFQLSPWSGTLYLRHKLSYKRILDLRLTAATTPGF